MECPTQECSLILDYFPFNDFREHQRETLLEAQRILETKDNLIIQAPTGIGKSAMAIAFSRYYHLGYITTDQKSLQNQYLKDFRKHVETVKGRNNFVCNINSNQCDSGKCRLDRSYECICKPYSSQNFGDGYIYRDAGVSEKRGDLYWKCDSESECDYWKQKMNALNSPIAIQNYTYFMIESNYIRDFGKRILLISDEGHNIEKHILSFVTVSMDDKILSDINNDLEFPKISKNDIINWNLWLEDLKINKVESKILELDSKIENAKERLQEIGSNKNNYKRDSQILEIEDEIKLYIKIIDDLQSLINKLNFYLKDSVERPENWVIETNEKKNGHIYKVIFKPIKVDKYTNSFYFQYASKNIIMSATVLDAEMLITRYGLDSNNTGYINVPSIFPSENKKIYHLDVGKLNFKNLSGDNPNNKLQDIVDAIDTVLELYPSQKGMIHTTTYPISNLIKKRSRNSSRILVHNSNNREKILEQHKESKKPTVLCSPSMTEGVDLMNDLSRFQILIKVPYANIADSRIMKIKNTDKKYYNWLAAVAISQSIGRSIRSEDDWADTFTLDSRFVAFVMNNSSFFKDTFLPYIRPTSEFVRNHGSELKRIMDRNKTKLKWFDKNVLSY